MIEQSKILIVDDKPQNLFALEKVLSVLDAIIIKASSGNDAMKATLKHNFTLMILDVQMPEMNGYELAEAFRSIDETKLIPIIFLSAVYSTDYFIFKGYESGAIDYIVKPADSKILINKCRVFMQLDRQKKELEEKNNQLEHYRNHLEELISERTEELKEANKQVIHAEKLSAIGKLSASIAHEFNNPICGIRNVLETVAENYNDKNEEANLVNIAIRECSRIADLVKALHDFSRPTTGTALSVNIRNAINDICLLYNKKLTERNITLEIEYDNDNIIIECVFDQIKQVLLNIIQNAEESITEKGGKIVVSVEHNNQNVLIHIKDTGIGIPEKNINTIFDPFFTTKHKTKGTGLGLAVCYGIINKHKGKITVENNEGSGTTFTVTLPVKAEGLQSQIINE